MKELIQITASITLLALACVIARAECKCGSHSMAGTSRPRVQAISFGFGSAWEATSFVATNQILAIAANSIAVHEPNPLQADGRRYSAHPSAKMAFQTDRMVPQVSGTLGMTYQRRTHAIPEDRHPRIGMLAVRDRGSVSHLSVQRMSGFRMKEDVWLYETDRPLTSWTENIVRVEACQQVQDVEPYKTMFVRLIPGRIVYLDFH